MGLERAGGSFFISGAWRPMKHGWGLVPTLTMPVLLTTPDRSPDSFRVLFLLSGGERQAR